jgi:formylglycine-generating enzyme required for sulfatase activity
VITVNPASLPDYALFRECEGCPEMVVMPAGTFQMGSPASEAGRNEDEDTASGAGGGTARVSIGRFAMGRFETTWDEWTACVNAGVCSQGPVDGAGGDLGWGKGRRPVINVDWNDAGVFAGWVNGRTGGGYRRPTEAEWEYAARAGTGTAYPWGAAVSRDHANYGAEQCCSGVANGADRWVNTAPIGSFRANPWGLFDMHGNVWEWVEDCYRGDLSGQTAAAYTTSSCSSRVIRGGSWYTSPQVLRSADRSWGTPSGRVDYIGFRLSRTL